MPEYPDIQLYRHALRRQLVGRTIGRARVLGPALLRSVDPPIADAEGRRLLDVERLGKRLVWVLEGDLYLVLHLMIAGRLQWERSGKAAPRRHCQAVFEFEDGQLWLVERSPRKRAALHCVRGRKALATLDPGGLDLLHCAEEEFAARLRAAPHTIKRALCDPRLFDGIGNAYSDEILHRAGLSPFAHCSGFDEEGARALLRNAREVLSEWEVRLMEQYGEGFPPPKAITAFRPEMAVHGRYGQPCPVCGAPVQRVRHASNEINYCPGCQSGGRIFADRSLSRLLRSEWPRDLESLEEFRSRYGSDGPSTKRR